MALATCEHNKALTSNELKSWILELKRNRTISSHRNEYSVVVSEISTTSGDESYYYELHPKFEKTIDISLIG